MQIPLTDIEDILFRGKNIAHGVVDFTISGDSITLTVAPWSDLQSKTIAFFPKAIITSKETQAKDGNIELPWDIIGFASYSLDSQRYRFVLRCDEVELVLESLWPKIAS